MEKERKSIKAGVALVTTFLFLATLTTTVSAVEKTFDYTYDPDPSTTFSMSGSQEWDEGDEIPSGGLLRKSFVTIHGDYYWSGLKKHGYGAQVIFWTIHDGQQHHEHGEVLWSFKMRDGTVSDTTLTYTQDWSGFAFLPVGLPIDVHLVDEEKDQLQVLTITVTRWVDDFSPTTKVKKIYGNHGGGGGGGSCFLAGTQITMADSSTKNIEDIQVGDLVQSYNTITNTKIPGVVTETYIHNEQEMGEYYIEINNELSVTPNHYLYTDGTWVQAQYLQKGDQVSTNDIQITTVEYIPTQVQTHDFRVEPLYYQLLYGHSTQPEAIPPILPYYADEYLSLKPGEFSQVAYYYT